MLKVKRIVKFKFISPGEVESPKKLQYWGGESQREFQMKRIYNGVLIDVRQLILWL